MLEVTYSREREIFKKLPHEVQQVVQGILKMLDSEYGEDRDKYADDGGYIIIIDGYRKLCSSFR